MWSTLSLSLTSLFYHGHVSLLYILPFQIYTLHTKTCFFKIKNTSWVNIILSYWFFNSRKVSSYNFLSHCLCSRIFRLIRFLKESFLWRDKKESIQPCYDLPSLKHSFFIHSAINVFVNVFIRSSRKRWSSSVPLRCSSIRQSYIICPLCSTIRFFRPRRSLYCRFAFPVSDFL